MITNDHPFLSDPLPVSGVQACQKKGEWSKYQFILRNSKSIHDNFDSSSLIQFLQAGLATRTSTVSKHFVRVNMYTWTRVK